MNPPTRKCTKCETEKLLTEFHKNRSRKDGYASWCKKCNNVQNKKYYETNTQKVKEMKKKHYCENREEMVERGRKWKQENKEKVIEGRKKYNQTEKRKALNKIYKHRRRARKKNNGCEDFTQEQLLEHWRQEGINPDKCYYCETGEYEHLDHYIPIAKGGPHFMSNLRPSCRACNLSKNDKMPEEWLESK